MKHFLAKGRENRRNLCLLINTAKTILMVSDLENFVRTSSLTTSSLASLETDGKLVYLGLSISDQGG